MIFPSASYFNCRNSPKRSLLRSTRRWCLSSTKKDARTMGVLCSTYVWYFHCVHANSRKWLVVFAVIVEVSPVWYTASCTNGALSWPDQRMLDFCPERNQSYKCRNWWELDWMIHGLEVLLQRLERRYWWWNDGNHSPFLELLSLRCGGVLMVSSLVISK